MDKNKFGSLMAGLAENFSAKLTPQGIKLRYQALKSYSYEQVEKASIQILKTRKYTTMPTVADFIEALEGNPDEKAEVQKSLVMSAINRYDPRQKFSDPVTQEVINNIGWHKIGQVNKKEIPFILKDFKEMYKSYSSIANGNTLNPPPELKHIAHDVAKRLSQ